MRASRHSFLHWIDAHIMVLCALIAAGTLALRAIEAPLVVRDVYAVAVFPLASLLFVRSVIGTYRTVRDALKNR